MGRRESSLGRIASVNWQTNRLVIVKAVGMSGLSLAAKQGGTAGSLPSLWAGVSF